MPSFVYGILLYSIDDLDFDKRIINMTTRGPYTFEVERSFVKPIYDDHKKVINYTMQHNYTQISPSDDDLSNVMIN